MRFYCLTSITLIPPYEKYIKPIPYDEDADETYGIGLDEAQTPYSIKNICENPDFYELTEICIGFKEMKYGDRQIKMYLMNLYRKDTGLFQIALKRSAIFIEKDDEPKKDKKPPKLDFIITTSKLFPHVKIDFDLKVQIRHIKHTSTAGIISESEEEIYEKYAKEIYDKSKYDYVKREALIQSTPFPLKFDNKKVNDKINEFKTLITKFCDPQNGSYKNIQSVEKDTKTGEYKIVKKRYDQELDSLLRDRHKWVADKRRKGQLEKQVQNHQGCRELLWKKSTLADLKLDNIDLDNLESISFEYIEIFVAKNALHPALEKFNFTNLKTLKLHECNIKLLNDDFVKKLPAGLKTLILTNNDITKISNFISQLITLEELDLTSNKNLDDDGIPWKHLPENIKLLKLNGTNITKIPEEIKNLKKLVLLHVNSPQLKFVSWSDISKTIERLSIKGGGEKINDFAIANKLRLKELHICHAGLEDINCNNLPHTLKYLFLINNNIAYFDNEKALPFLDTLYLNENNLLSINWKNLPRRMVYLCLDNNQLECIDDISHLINLFSLFANNNQIKNISGGICKLEKLAEIDLSHNSLSSLPVGFETLPHLRNLEIDKNEFYLSKDNLDEALWNRVPKELDFLSLRENGQLCKLPCQLKNNKIEILNVAGCNISHICPYLYFEQRKTTDSLIYLNISNNDELTLLPFVPLTIYQPPYANEKTEKSITRSTLELTTEKEERYRVTSDFPITPKIPRKPLYSFEHSENQNFGCQCCASCGQTTDEPIIEQLMVMDFIGKFANVQRQIPQKKAAPESKRRNPKRTSMEASDSAKEEKKVITSTIPRCYDIGKWKTNVRTRMCSKCIHEFKLKTDAAFEESKLIQAVGGLSIKRQNIEDQDNHEEENMDAEENNLVLQPNPEQFYANSSAPENNDFPAPTFPRIGSILNRGNDVPPQSMLYTLPEKTIKNIELVDTKGEHLVTIPVSDNSLNNCNIAAYANQDANEYVSSEAQPLIPYSSSNITSTVNPTTQDYGIYTYEYPTNSLEAFPVDNRYIYDIPEHNNFIDSNAYNTNSQIPFINAAPINYNNTEALSNTNPQQQGQWQSNNEFAPLTNALLTSHNDLINQPTYLYPNKVGDEVTHTASNSMHYQQQYVRDLNQFPSSSGQTNEFNPMPINENLEQVNNAQTFDEHQFANEHRRYENL